MLRLSRLISSYVDRRGESELIVVTLVSVRLRDKIYFVVVINRIAIYIYIFG